MVSTTKFDHQDVVQKATNLFWEKGFHATSMRNLQEAIDMRPGSIYASFGSKEGLFKEVLQHYTNHALSMIKSFETIHESPLEALRAFFCSIVLKEQSAKSTNMCMLVKTISELTDDNGELLAEAQQLLKTLEIAYSDLFMKAQAAGEIDKNADPRRLASLLQMQVMGLKAYARANEGTGVDMKQLADDAFASLK